MTAREKKLGILFCALLAACAIFINLYYSFAAKIESDRLFSENETVYPLASRANSQLKEKKAVLDMLRKANTAPPLNMADPYVLGSISKKLLERSGARIKSFSLTEKNKSPFIESSISADMETLVALFTRIDETSPLLVVSYCSVSLVKPDSLDIVLRIGYATGY